MFVSRLPEAMWQIRWTRRLMPQTERVGRWSKSSCRSDYKSAQTCWASERAGSRGRIDPARPPDRQTALSARQEQSRHARLAVSCDFPTTKQTSATAENSRLSRGSGRQQYRGEVTCRERGATAMKKAVPSHQNPTAFLLPRPVQKPVFYSRVALRQPTLRPYPGVKLQPGFARHQLLISRVGKSDREEL